VLELGGKAPLVVLDDADLDAAVSGAAFGAFANSGQICMSTERIVVDRRIADAFVDRLGTEPNPATRAKISCINRLFSTALMVVLSST